MSVVANFRVDTRPYAGYSDPGFPIASYVASGSLTGDGTGGIVQITFIFQNNEADIVTERYNLEQLHVDAESAVNVACIMQAQGMDHRAFPFQVLIEQRWGMVLITDTVGDAPVSLGDLAGLPLWLGMPQPEVDAGVRFQFTNTDTIVFNASIQGFIWGPRSILVDGGPKRPPNGYFR